MENETISININRNNFLTLIEVENYIRDVLARYQNVGVGYIQNYSQVTYHNGLWGASVTVTSRDPNSAQALDGTDFGF